MQNLKRIKIIFLLMLSCILLKATENANEILNERANSSRQDWLNRTLIKLVSNQSGASFRNIKCKIFLSLGADPNTRDQFGLTSLHHAAMHNNVKQIRKLISARADIDVVDKYGSKPLCYTILTGKNEAANEIINQIKNLNKSNSTACLEQKNGFNLTPLHLAVSFNRLEIVQRLLSLGVNPDGITSAGETTYSKTPLHYAAEISNFDLIELLLSYGANKDAIDNKQETIFDILRKKDIPHSRACLEELNKKLGLN
jgi:serine/threonine-protein phosphatase 6 regulatory ankyrin repeat subunit B